MAVTKNFKAVSEKYLKVCNHYTFAVLMQVCHHVNKYELPQLTACTNFLKNYIEIILFKNAYNSASEGETKLYNVDLLLIYSVVQRILGKSGTTLVVVLLTFFSYYLKTTELSLQGQNNLLRGK